MYPLRTACSILEEIRMMDKTRNYAGLLGLIEELQSAFNKMEAGLDGKHDLVKLDEERHALHKKVKKLRAYVETKAEKIGFKISVKDKDAEE